MYIYVYIYKYTPENQRLGAYEISFWASFQALLLYF